MKNRIPYLDVGHGLTTPLNKKRYKFLNYEGLEVIEGEINRNIAKLLANKLIEADIPFYGNFKIDKDTPLRERTEAINDLYSTVKELYTLSIHNNSASANIEGYGTSAVGTEIWTSKGETTSDLLVPFFYNAYKEFFPNRPYRKDWLTGEVDKEAPFWMLKRTYCPSILVECAFFDNWNEVKEILTSLAGLDRLTNWVVKGVKDIYESDI